MMHKRGKPMQEHFATAASAVCLSVTVSRARATSTPPRVHGNETNAASQKLAWQLSNGASFMIRIIGRWSIRKSPCPIPIHVTLPARPRLRRKRRRRTLLCNILMLSGFISMKKRRKAINDLLIKRYREATVSNKVDKEKERARVYLKTVSL